MPNVCVLISGCGFLDGAEIHESVLSLLYLTQAGATYQVAAPHKQQMHVVNHHTGEVAEGARGAKAGDPGGAWAGAAGEGPASGWHARPSWSPANRPA